jgi:hypothetical protein
MDYNVNFKGRLVIDGMTQNKTRWKNIAKIFKEETKGINYESRIFDNSNVLEVFVDRLPKKNRAYDCIDDFNSRELALTQKGTKELLAQPDGVIAKILAKHLQFIQNIDKYYKLAENTLDNAFGKVASIFEKKGFGIEHIQNIFDDVSPMALIEEKIISEEKELRILPGLKDANIENIG